MPYRSEILLLNAIDKTVGMDESKRYLLWNKLQEKLEILKDNPLDSALYENFDILKWVQNQISR